MARWVAGAVLAMGVAAGAPAQNVGNDLAKRFGARDNVLGVSISPDGKLLAIIQPSGARGSVVSIVKTDGGTDVKPILSSSGSPDRLTGCHWTSDTRLACGIYMIDFFDGERTPVTRMLAVNADGSGVKVLSAQRNDRALWTVADGGDIVDWTGGKGEGSVLMTRYYVPEHTVGTLLSSTAQGLGVERIDTRSLAREAVEPPSSSAGGYLSDGRGHVRIMSIVKNNTLGQYTGELLYRYRKKDGREWLPLGTVTYSNYRAQGFQPLAVDPDLDVVYGLEKIDGRTGLYKIALDGSMKKELAYGRPDADIDDLVQIGRQHRVVGVSWVTDRRSAALFDPALKRLAGALSKVLPNTPNISFVDASANEQQLVLFVSSDTDPGRFYLYDQSTKHLSEILPVRPQLASTKLGRMTAIRYQAADGASVPAYLTLPAGSTGKNLPAVVLPHGGPTYRDEWDFDWLPQYFASRGYAVIQPEFRGSSGFGDEWFLQNGIRSWRAAIGDVDDAGRWLVAQGIADPAKLAIVGWSYGGYAALQSQVVDPGLFKAVVAIAPVTDWGLLKGASEGRSKKEVDAIFGDASVVEMGSPARHADRFAAPVLMFQGDVDQNVPVTQSRLMESKLRAAKKNVQRVEYKGLDHQLEDSVVRAEMLDKTDAFLRKAMSM